MRHNPPPFAWRDDSIPPQSVADLSFIRYGKPNRFRRQQSARRFLAIIFRD